MSSTAPAEMKVKAIAPWFGSKRNLADRIVAEFGDHSAYWGLCVGSFALEMVKRPCAMETVVDLNGDLTNLALVIQDDHLCQEMEERLHRTYMSDEVFRRSARVIRTESFVFQQGDAPNGQRAYHYFVFCWMGRNGDSGTTKVGYGFCKRNDHVRLAFAMRRFKKTRCVISYYEEPEIGLLYPGWTKVHLKATKAMVNQGRRDQKGAVKAPEILLINGPSFTQEKVLF